MQNFHKRIIMKDFMSYADSLKILKDTINAWEKVEKVAITDALDRNIAYDVVAAENYPAKPVSAMDGYAFAFKEGLSELELITDLPATCRGQQMRQNLHWLANERRHRHARTSRKRRG